MPPRAPDLETHWLINFSDMFPTGQNLGPTKELRVIDFFYSFFGFLTALQKLHKAKIRIAQPRSIHKACDIILRPYVSHLVPTWHKLGPSFESAIDLKSLEDFLPHSYSSFPSSLSPLKAPLEGHPKEKASPTKEDHQGRGLTH